GLPPGPPLAAVIGRFSGYSYMSSPSRTVESATKDFPLPPTAASPPMSSSQYLAPSKVHVSTGLYFITRLVVGCSRLTASMRFFWLGARRLIPTCDTPTVLSSSASSAGAWLVMVALVVLNASSADTRSGAAAA